MSLESNEIIVGSTGHVYRAPFGTAFPTNITTAVNDALWTELGYTTEDGVKFTFGRENEEFFGWQSYDPLRIITSKIPKEIMCTFAQFNQNTWATALGGGTWAEATNNNFVYTPPAEDVLDQFAYMVSWTDSTLSYRLCFYKVQNMSGVEFSLTRANPILMPVTVKVLAPGSGNPPYIMQTNDENLGDYTLAGS